VSQWNLEHVVIVGYDSRWPTIFKETAVWLRETRRDLVLRVEHFGSTAIPGLPPPHRIAPDSVFRACPARPFQNLKPRVGTISERRSPARSHDVQRIAPHGPRTHHVHMAPCDTNCGRGCIFVTTSSNIATKRRNMRV